MPWKRLHYDDCKLLDPIGLWQQTICPSGWSENPHENRELRRSSRHPLITSEPPLNSRQRVSARTAILAVSEWQVQ